MDQHRFIDRRTIFGAFGALGMGATAPAIAQPAPGLGPSPIEDGMVAMPDGLPMLRAVERIERSMEEQEVVWWYHFTWFGLRPDRKPQRLLRFEGIEMTRIRKLGPGRYETHGHNVSYPRTADGTEWLARWRNPYTDADVVPQDNVIENDPGHERGAQGVRSLAPGGVFRPYDVTFRVEGDRLKLERVRMPPPTWPGQFIETSVTAVSLDLFRNSDDPCLPAEGSGMWVQPPPKWLDMGHGEAVLVGYFSGRKAPAYANLPEGFRRRLEARHPHLAHVPDSKFRLT